MSSYLTANRWLSYALFIMALVSYRCDIHAAMGNEPNLANVITNAVMAQDVKGASFEPAGITDSFPANQRIFHAVLTITDAPDNTVFKVIWLSDSNQNMGEVDIKSSGSRNLDFSFVPNAGTLPAGKYAAQIFVNGQMNRALNFSVMGSSANQVNKPAPAVSGFINEVTLALDTTGPNKDPVNSTAVFNNSATFHAVTHIQNAPPNTKFKAEWYLVDAGSPETQNSFIDSAEIVADGSRNIDFSLKPNTTWPPGKYRVEISVNGELDTIKTFSVQ